MKLTHTQYRLLKSRSKSKLEQCASSFLNTAPGPKPSAILPAAYAS
jgi:hypothetical protein